MEVPSSFTSVTCAPGMIAPEGSRTVPEMAYASGSACCDFCWAQTLAGREFRVAKRIRNVPHRNPIRRLFASNRELVEVCHAIGLRPQASFAGFRKTLVLRLEKQFSIQKHDK